MMEHPMLFPDNLKQTLPDSLEPSGLYNTPKQCASPLRNFNGARKDTSSSNSEEEGKAMAKLPGMGEAKEISFLETPPSVNGMTCIPGRTPTPSSPPATTTTTAVLHGRTSRPTKLSLTTNGDLSCVRIESSSSTTTMQTSSSEDCAHPTSTSKKENVFSAVTSPFTANPLPTTTLSTSGNHLGSTQRLVRVPLPEHPDQPPAIGIMASPSPPLEGDEKVRNPPVASDRGEKSNHPSRALREGDAFSSITTDENPSNTKEVSGASCNGSVTSLSSTNKSRKQLPLRSSGSSSSSSPSRSATLLLPRIAYVRKATFFTSRNRLNEALAVYDEALTAYPSDSDLLNCKGVCLRNLQRVNEAFSCYSKALESDATNASAWNNRGVIFKEKECYDKAIHCYMMALHYDSDHRTATTNLAVAFTDLGTKLKAEGHLSEALDRYYEALHTDPAYSPCLYNLGVILSEMGDSTQAMQMYLEAIKLNPRYVEAYNNMGAICKNMGHLNQAIMYYERALQANPNFEMSKGNLAVALTDLGTQVKLRGNVKEGVRLYKKALVYNPHYGDAYYNLGVAYGEQFKYDKALVYYELAVSFNPRCAEAYNNLGVIYKDKENLDKAIFYYNKALEVNPRFAQTLNNIGVIYTVVGKMTEAHDFTKRALEVNPNYAEAYNNLGVLYRDQGDVTLAIQAYEKSIAIDHNARNALQNRLLALNYLDGIPASTIYTASKEWGELFTASRIPYTSWKCDKNIHRPIVVGYIGPDFFTHSVSYFIHAPLLFHNSSRVQVIVYANVIKEDEKTQMFKKLVPHWKSIVGMSDRAAAALIHADKVDILIELAGHTANNRLDVLAWKPAPIQVTWIGYPNTTGLPTIDYRISDGRVDDQISHQRTTEQLMRLPDCFLCYTPAPDAPLPASPPALENEFVTFGSFNNLAKIGPQVIRLWGHILRSIPNSRLLVKARPFANSTVKKKFFNLFEKEGIASERLDLMGLVPVCADHLKTYALLDIALDTFPYAGTTTTCESLLMGVPVITLKGDSNHAHNVGVSLLTTIGHSELIAENEQSYIEKALQLATDSKRLAYYRTHLRKNMLASPLGDGKRFTENLEDAYATMFRTKWASVVASES